MNIDVDGREPKRGPDDLDDVGRAIVKALVAALVREIEQELIAEAEENKEPPGRALKTTTG